MNRRTFLAAIAALPFVGRFVKAESKPFVPSYGGNGLYSIRIAFKRSTTGAVGDASTLSQPDRVRIYGSDDHPYSSTGPWFLTK